MANATTNLMSININPSAGSAGSSSGNSTFGYRSSQKGGNDFNSALDRASNTLNRQAAPAQANPSDAEEISYSDAATKNPEAPVDNTNNTANQGQNTKSQDAPQNVTKNSAAETNVPAEIDTKNVLNDSKIEVDVKNILPDVEVQPEIEISDGSDVQNILPFMFSANTESLLPPQVTENTGEVNLMTVVPQSGENKGQEMLNILSGKTWTAEDVQATLTSQNQGQNPQQVSTELNPNTLNNFPQNDKNFTFNPNQNQSENQPQILVRQNTLVPEQPQLQEQSANLNQPTNLNLEQSPQVQTQQVNLTQEQTLQPTVQRQIEMQNQPILNSVNPQVEPKQTNQFTQMADLFSGSLQIEDIQNQNAPLSPIQPALRQQPEQQNQSQTPQQSDNQSQNQNLSTPVQDSAPEVQTQAQVQNFGGEENFTQNITPANNNVQPQPVVQTQAPETLAQAPREVDIPAQIVEQARLIRTAENTEMVINLKPEHLGQLTLRVSVSQNGAVNASFYSDNAQVRAAIENSIVQLKQELNDQGLKVENVQVSSYLSDSGLMNGQGGQAWQQQQQQSRSQQLDFDALQDEVDAVTPEAEINSADGVDYKI